MLVIQASDIDTFNGIRLFPFAWFVLICSGQDTVSCSEIANSPFHRLVHTLSRFPIFDTMKTLQICPNRRQTSNPSKLPISSGLRRTMGTLRIYNNNTQRTFSHPSSTMCVCRAFFKGVFRDWNGLSKSSNGLLKFASGPILNTACLVAYFVWNL